MTFTVTYRAKDGALREECVEAANRAECVAECRKRGIAPKGIKEGRSGKSAASPKRAATVGSPRRGDRPGRPALVAAISVLLLILAGGAWWWFAVRSASGPQSAATSAAAPAAKGKPKAARSASGPYQATTNAAPPATARVDARPPAQAERPAPTNASAEVVWQQVSTNASGVVTERFRTADGKLHRVIHPPKRVFENPSDQLIAMAISASKHGGPMPPLPLTDATEQDFLQSLTTPIVVNDDDPPDVKELKQEVADVRKELVELVKGGMTVKEALQEHQRNVNNNAALRDDAMQKLAEVRAEGDKELAEEYKKRVNEQLEKRGIAPLK